MMENKCNKTPNSNSKYLDHVYCHTSESKNYIRANNNAASGGGGTGGTTTAGADFLALLKENKQLKAMLILHLELIQEQNDQLMAKDKQLASQSEELESMRGKNVQLEAQMLELQKQLQRQLKRAAVAAGEISSLPPPPLAKIQCKTELSLPPLVVATSHPLNNTGAAIASDAKKTTNIIGECNGKLISKIILHRVTVPGRGVREGTRSPNSTTTSDTTSEADDAVSKSQPDEDEDVEEEEDEVEEETGTGNTTTEDDSNDTLTTGTVKRQRHKIPPLSLALPRGAKPRQPISTTPPTSISGPVQVCVTPPTPSRGKQMPLMMWHAPQMHSESESASCDSMVDTEQHSAAQCSPATVKNSLNAQKQLASRNLGPPSNHVQRQTRSKSRRWTYISTPQPYCTREWEDDEFLCDYEFIKEEANALRADTPNLEIPKWTEHELSPSYCIEGTEDLCDETFLKRHAKFEVDEKRRKKWDVQQIREQRRIEKLKRRHCKDELQVPQEPQPLHSFYPQADAIQTICFMGDLPVQAFGEMIPKLGANVHFALPWLEATTPTTSTSASGSSTIMFVSGSASSNAVSTTQTQHNSSFVFLKKRKRQQSSSNCGTTIRQKCSATAATVTSTKGLPTTIQNTTTPSNSSSEATK